jgi:hypothetical protein
MAVRDHGLSRLGTVGAVFIGAWLVVTGAGMVPPALAHQALTTYEGGKTCSTTECHVGKAAEVHGSAHYQWKGPTPGVPNLAGQTAGKWGSINDFCTYPNINFLFQMTNLAGATVVTGCGNCHAGRGLPPSPIATPEQLNNVDCLICHSDLYKRVGAMVNGQPTFITDPTVDVAAATAAIQKTPSRATCLTRCHVSAGGGPGFKQGDIDPLQIDPPKSLDVHMASVANGGPGLSCLDCHRVTNHRFAGRGNDIRETDLNAKVTCLDCHANPPHTSSNAGYQDLNRHLARVNCTVCHIPAFGRNAPTDIMRDFTKTEVDATNKRYEPVRTFATNVMPNYLWFNGLSYFYEFGKAITLYPGYKYFQVYPLGDINDPNAKINAFKLHRAKLGYILGTRQQIPVKSKVLWETGNIDQAFRQGAAEVGWTVPGYGFANSQRYYSLYHEVAPKENALQCAACHVSTGRLNFKDLGYTVRAQRNGQPLCASCHGLRTADFYKIHKEHREESISCTTCHYYKTAPLLGPGRIDSIYLLLEN